MAGDDRACYSGIISTFTSSIVLLVLLVMQSGVSACPIVIGQSAATADSEFRLSGGGAGEALDDDPWREVSTPDQLNLLQMLNIVGIDADADHKSGESSALGYGALQSMVLLPNFGVNSSPRSGPLRRSHVARNGDVFEHDVTVGLYFAVYAVDYHAAEDVLTSYRAVGRITGDISAAIDNAVGLRDDYPGTPVDTNAFTPDNNTNNAYSFNNINSIITWIKFILSVDAIPYYIIIISAWVMFEILKNFLRKN